jgi:glycosyltransferase involved in cell wall biosynthesis
MPKVSVIIPTYNSAKYLPSAIDSVLKQTFKDYEIIVIDDGSTDNTKEVIDSYDHKIACIYQDNQGPSVARNKGILQSKGEFIAFLDADDIWETIKIEEQFRIFACSEETGIVSTELSVIDETGKLVEGRRKMIPEERGALIQELMINNVIGTCSTVMVRKSCFDAVGLFDETLKVAEDWDMWLRLCKIFKHKRIAKPLVNYRIMRGSQSYYGKTNLENELRFLDKLFLNKEYAHKWLVKRRAYCYRYFKAARAFVENKDIRSARKYIIKSFLMNPLNFLFDSNEAKLLGRLLMGERLFSLVKRKIERID